MKSISDLITELGEIPLCNCGCGQKVNVNPNNYLQYKKNGYPKFINHHNRKGCKHSLETIEKMKEVQKNAQGTPEARKRNSESHKGQIPWIKGKHHSDETKEILKQKSLGNKSALGNVVSPENRKKMIEGLKEVQSTEEYRKHVSESKTGDKHPNWQNGISYAPYCPKFNNKFKEDIRNRDNRICQLCGKTELENRRRLSVHHIHGDKPNCYPDCITLCQYCNLHMVEKKETKKYYENLFMNMLNDRDLLFWSRRREKEKELMMR